MSVMLLMVMLGAVLIGLGSLLPKQPAGVILLILGTACAATSLLLLLVAPATVI